LPTRRPNRPHRRPDRNRSRAADKTNFAPAITTNNRLAERSRDFLSAFTRLEEALVQPEGSFLRGASRQRCEFTYELA
jgi:hypothetical protein